MLVSIIIPTLNESEYVGRLLRSLEQQRDLPEHEIIVVDASADDLTANAVSAAQLPNVTITRSAVADVGHQRNIGARLARHDYLLFVDADVILGSNVILRALRRLGPAELGLVSARHRPDRTTAATSLLLVTVYALIVVARCLRYPVTNGDFVLTNSKTFSALGGFAEGALLGEDTDFGVRAHRIGARHHMEWRACVTASSRRLALMPAHRLLRVWASAYLRAVNGEGPTGLRDQDADYPYGVW